MILSVEIRQENYGCAPENITFLIEANSKLSKEILQLKTNLEESEKRVALLVEQIKLSKLRQFGKKTESSEQLQLELVFDEIEE